MMMRGVVRALPWFGSGKVPLAVSMDDAKMHLRIDHSDDDLMIEAYLRAAITSLDGPAGELKRGLITQDFAYDLPCFPCDVIEIPMCGVSEVSAIKYLDNAGVSQTVSDATWKLVTDNRFTAYIALKVSQFWPSALSQPAAVSIEFKSGFGPAASDIPFPIKAAILLHMAQLFERRSDDAGELPPAAMALVSNYRPLSI